MSTAEPGSGGTGLKGVARAVSSTGPARLISGAMYRFSRPALAWCLASPFSPLLAVTLLLAGGCNEHRPPAARPPRAATSRPDARLAAAVDAARPPAPPALPGARGRAITILYDAQLLREYDAHPPGGVGPP